eukprot:CAMPEP_0115831680 /NCGR_PEP_ID=MMETSP0287-20121206/2265_1 /TAXON_ID=412157 /ORGANISM="Chrysochromulina rotalis, Strain UIO044" /LENGTH=61 /DNA_ID=CAMNT_0003285037 /DNA_START=556 /DNA_END=741 /DNA_ORIENTATION=+
MVLARTQWTAVATPVEDAVKVPQRNAVIVKKGHLAARQRPRMQLGVHQAIPRPDAPEAATH